MMLDRYVVISRPDPSTSVAAVRLGAAERCHSDSKHRGLRFTRDGCVQGRVRCSAAWYFDHNLSLV